MHLLHEDRWTALERSLCFVERGILFAWTVVADAALVEGGPLFDACMNRRKLIQGFSVFLPVALKFLL